MLTIKHTLFLIKRPSQIQEDRNMGCLCCVSGPLSVTVRTDRGAFCSGELMTVTVYANNQTSHRILGVELELIQDTIFIASGGRIPLMNFSSLIQKLNDMITTNAWFYHKLSLLNMLFACQVKELSRLKFLQLSQKRARFLTQRVTTSSKWFLCWSHP